MIPDFNPRFSSSVNRDYPGPSALEPSQRKTQQSSECSSRLKNSQNIWAGIIGKLSCEQRTRREPAALAGQRSTVTQRSQVTSGGGFPAPALEFRSISEFPRIFRSNSRCSQHTECFRKTASLLGTNVPTSVSATGLRRCTPAGLQVLRDPGGGFPHPATAELPQVPEPDQEGRKRRGVNREKAHFRAGRGPGRGRNSDWIRNLLIVEVRVKVGHGTGTRGVGGGG